MSHRVAEVGGQSVFPIDETPGISALAHRVLSRSRAIAMPDPLDIGDLIASFTEEWTRVACTSCGRAVELARGPATCPVCDTIIVTVESCPPL